MLVLSGVFAVLYAVTAWQDDSLFRVAGVRSILLLACPLADLRRQPDVVHADRRHRPVGGHDGQPGRLRRRHAEWPGHGVALAIALGVGVAVGFVNGVAIGVFRVNPLIMTLGMASILLGIVTVGLRGFLVRIDERPRRRARRRLGHADRPAAGEPHRVGGRRRRCWCSGLRSSGLGRMIYAVGDNPIACRLAGVRVWQVLLAVYVLRRAARRRRRAAVLRHHRLRRRRPDQQLPAAVRRGDGDRRHIDPRRLGRLQRHDPRRPHPHRAQPAAAAPRRERGVQADALRRHRAGLAWVYVRLTGQKASDDDAPIGEVSGGRDRDTGFMGVGRTPRRCAGSASRSSASSARRRSGRGPRRRRASLPPVVDSVDALLADPAVDVVHVTSPNHVHADQVRAALAAGKHVVCEKPLGVTPPRPPSCSPWPRPSGHRPRRLLQHPLLPAEPERRGAGRAPAPSASRASSPAATTRTGCCSTPTGTGAWTPPGRAGLRAVADIGSHWLDLVAVHHRPAVVEVVSPTCTRSSPSATTRRRGGDVRRGRATPTCRGSASRWRATTPPGCCCASRTARAACARSARSPRAARTAWRGRSTAPSRRWRGSPRTPSTCGSATGAAQRGHQQGPGADDAAGRRRRGVPRRACRGLPGHVPRPVRRRLPRHRGRRAVGAPDLPDVRRWPRRRAGVRGHRASARTGVVGQGRSTTDERGGIR